MQNQLTSVFKVVSQIVMSAVFAFSDNCDDMPCTPNDILVIDCLFHAPHPPFLFGPETFLLDCQILSGFVYRIGLRSFSVELWVQAKSGP